MALFPHRDILRPGFGKIKLAINYAGTSMGGIAHKTTNLAVIDLAFGPAPLSGNPNRVSPLLGKGRRIKDQNPVRVPKGFRKVPDHQISSFPVWPLIGANKSLKRFPVLAKKLRQGLSAFPRQIGDEALHILAPGFPGLASFAKILGIGGKKLIQVLNKAMDLGNSDTNVWGEMGRSPSIHKLPPQKFPSEVKDMQIRLWYKNYLMGQSSYLLFELFELYSVSVLGKGKSPWIFVCQRPNGKTQSITWRC